MIFQLFYELRYLFVSSLFNNSNSYCKAIYLPFCSRLSTSSISRSDGLIVSLNVQIFDWLSHSPTDIESYIRPGCVVLTMYLCQSDSAWEEVWFLTLVIS